MAAQGGLVAGVNRLPSGLGASPAVTTRRPAPGRVGRRVPGIEAVGLCSLNVPMSTVYNDEALSSSRKGTIMMAQPRWPNEVPLGARRAGQVARRRATLGRSTSLREAAARLAADRAGMAVVEDAGRPIEVMSLRDLAIAIAAGVDLDESTVGDLRLVRRPYIQSSAGLVPTLDKMIGAATSEALVLDEDGLVGVVTLAGICESLVSPTVEICAGVTSDPLSRGLQVQAADRARGSLDFTNW